MRAIQLRRRHRYSTVIIYFGDVPDTKGRQAIESMVARVEGVTDVHFNKAQKQLMIVDYDPGETNSDEILDRVRQQHHEAQLI